MRSIILTAVFTTGAATFTAQTLQDAINKTDNERYEAAAADFKSIIAKDPSKGENYFYFGENYFKNNEIDSALMMYEKGIEVQATNGFSYIGKGKVLLLQNKETEANTNIFKGKTLAGKNATILVKAAEAFIAAPVKNITEAEKIILEAIKMDAKNPEAYIIYGDILIEKSQMDGSAAIKNYEKAAELDKKSVRAILRMGKLYQRSKNWEEALKYYKKAEEIDPTFAPAYWQKAELYLKAGQAPKAVENFKKYLELNNSLSARVRYAQALYMAKQYKETISEIEAIFQKDKSNPYLNRVVAYAYHEVGNSTDKDAYTKGLEAINNFFTLTSGKNFKYIPDDYKFKGLLLAKTGQDSLGVIEIEKAIALDTVANCELNGEIAKVYLKAKKYEKSLSYFAKKGTCAKGLGAQDYFDYGRANFYIGGSKEKLASETKDKAAQQKLNDEAKEWFVKADSCFSKLTQLSPNYATGFFWRAKTNIHLDVTNEKWLAAPYFEKGFSMVKPEEREKPANKSDIITACEYLGYKALIEKNKEKAKEYFGIVQTLDPNNKKAKDFFASPESK